MTEQASLREAVEATLVRYALACDQRDWSGFDQVFTEGVRVNYGGEFHLEGRDKVVGLIRSMLAGCGPTQHLLGNFRIYQTETGQAQSACYVRAAHAGKGSMQGMFYEVWAEYIDSLERQADGRWLICQRTMKVHQETGDRRVLAPDSTAD